MNDSELDDLLASAAAPLPRAAVEEAGRMADATRPRRLVRGRPPRRRWVLPLLVGGAIALTAGAGTATVVMSHWAGVEMPLDNVRNSVPIPLTWTTESGHVEQCRAWIELRHPEPGDREALDAAIGARDWTGLGQQLFDDGVSDPGDDADGETRVAEGMAPVLREFAESVFPGVHWFGEGHGLRERAVDATGFTCVPEKL